MREREREREREGERERDLFNTETGLDAYGPNCNLHRRKGVGKEDKLSFASAHFIYFCLV